MLKFLKPASHRSLPDNDDLPDCATSRILACGIVRDRELLYFSPPSLFLFVARPTQLLHSLFIKFSIVAPVFSQIQDSRKMLFVKLAINILHQHINKYNRNLFPKYELSSSPTFFICFQFQFFEHIMLFASFAVITWIC